MSIGDGTDSSTQFVRIVGVAALRSAAVVVADAGATDVRMFAQSGKILKTVATRGEGPGQLQSLNWMGRMADTLFVFEGFPGPSRLHVFAEDRFLQRWRVRAANSEFALSVLARAESGDLLVRSGRGYSVTGVRAPGTFFRDTVQLGILRGKIDGGEITWLGEFPGTSMLWYGSPLGSSGAALAPDVLGAALVWCVSGKQIWLGDSGTGEVAVFDLKGSRKHKVRLDRPILTARLLEEMLRARLNEAENSVDSARIQAVFGKRRTPLAAPAFTRCVGGPEGEVWFEEFQVPNQLKRMVVLDSNGRVRARVVVPAAITVYEIGLNYVAGSYRDENGAESAVIHSLQR